MALSYLHYDVFTGTALVGNQLAVFTDARGLETSLMQAIAREMSFPESTFVLPAEQPGTDIRMRIFTPAAELPMAGHPTIGSTFALAEIGAIQPGSQRFVFGLNIGPIPVDLEWSPPTRPPRSGGAGESRLRFAWMTQLTPTFGPVVDKRAAVATAIGLTEADLMADLPIQEITCGLPYLYVPLRDRETVDRAISDAAGLRRLSATAGINVPVFLFSISPQGAPETVYSRMFAPEFGIGEDPATGSASGPLGCYLVRHRVVTGEAAGRIVSLQGVAMKRASRLHIAIAGDPDAITEVKVGGEAVLVGRGELAV